MAHLSRILRLQQLRPCVALTRPLTSKTNIQVAKLLPRNTLTNNVLIPKIRLTNNPWIWQINNKIDSPAINKTPIDFPNGLKYVPPLYEPTENKELELPTTPDSGISKEAARLIVIRRNKMKRHKLKKLRKRMKFEWAKRRQKREWNKEKVFQAVLIKQCKEGESFSAEKYVEERLVKFNEVNMQKMKSKKSLTDKQM